jgi:DNA-binding IclR family transcriptional regulator
MVTRIVPSTMAPQRTLEVLELFEKLRRPLRVSQVCSILRYPQSSTSVLMNDLKLLGYLNLDPIAHQYTPSLRVAMIGGYLKFDGVDGHQVLNLLSSIRDKTNFATLLSARNGVHLQYIYTLDPPGLLMQTFKAGKLRPITRVSAGLVLLAACTDAEIGRIVRHQNSLPEEWEREDLAEVMKQVYATRQRGYACLQERLRKRIGSLAITLPFRDSLGKPLALGVSGPADEVSRDQEKLVEILHNEVRAHCALEPTHGHSSAKTNLAHQ